MMDDNFDRNLPKGLTLREHIENYIGVAKRMHDQIADNAEDSRIEEGVRLVAAGAAEAVGCSVSDLQAILDHMDLEAMAAAEGQT